MNGFVDYGWSELDSFRRFYMMGHAIGLGHPCLTAQSFGGNSCVAVMAATAGDYPSLRQDDINAVANYIQAHLVVSVIVLFRQSGNSGICIEDDGISYCAQQANLPRGLCV